MRRGDGSRKWLIVHDCVMMSYCHLSHEIPSLFAPNYSACACRIEVFALSSAEAYVWLSLWPKRSSDHPSPSSFWKDGQFILEAQPPPSKQQPFPRPAGCPGEECWQSAVLEQSCQRYFPTAEPSVITHIKDKYAACCLVTRAVTLFRSQALRKSTRETWLSGTGNINNLW